jgi:hypothetical protein
MKLTIAAVRSGTDPIGPLPPGAFHRTLEDQVLCPKCDVAYNLVVEYDRAIERHFEESSRQIIRLLRRAVGMGHDNGHRVTHFETSGAVVRSYTKPEPIEAKPISKHIM